jgi:small subunit ribosomal protein S9
MPETIKPQKPRTPRAPAARHATGAAAHVPKEHKAAPAAKAASGKYVEAVGHRKTSVARVRLFEGTGKMTVNGKDAKQYFSLPRLVADAMAPLTNLKIAGEWDVSAKVSGGGIHAQAGAVRLGVSRALVKKNDEWKKRLRVLGFLTRDSRMVERKKYGLKKARRSPQWAKR